MTNLPIKRANTEGGEEQHPGMEWLYSGVDIESRRIEIRGEVNEIMSSIIVRALLKMSSINKEPIEIYLSSFGGDVYEALAIYAAFRQCDCDIHVIASGKIMSAAFVIFLGGDIRIAAKNTTFMMHSASYGAEGTVKNHEVQVVEGKRINNIFLEIAAERTKKPKAWWYRKILSFDYYLNEVEAAEIGVISGQKTKAIEKKVVKKKKVKNVRKKV